MKLELYSGCVTDSLEVDGEPFNDLPAKKKKTVSMKLLNYLLDNDGSADFAARVVEQYGEREFITRCEQCLDDECKTILEI